MIRRIFVAFYSKLGFFWSGISYLGVSASSNEET